MGDPVRNADGTWEITYDIDVANTIAPNVYDLTDGLTFGGGIVIEAATVANTDPGDIATDTSWDGQSSQTVAADVPIGAGVSHTYRVVVTATVPTTSTSSTTDCTVTGTETGTGFLNGATVTTEDQTIDDDACAPAPNVSIVKDLVGDPVVNDDNTVDLTYNVTVTNTGAGADRYDLDDELQFGNDVTVNDASVVNFAPGDVTLNPAWDGIADTSVATDVDIAGAGTDPVVHVYVVTVNATIGTETTVTEADCTIDAGEDGTGFLNEAVLTIDEHTADDDACGEVDPVIEVTKRMVGAPSANGDGTWTIDYDVVATNVGPAPGTYDLDDTLTYGQSVSVVAADVSNTEPGGIGTNRDWDGINEVAVVRQQPIALGTSHTYRVTVVASVAPGLTTAASDCEIGDGETGTGFLNTATLAHEGGSSEDDACGEIPNITIVKTVKDAATMSSTGAVELTYVLTVSNTGEAAGTYQLDDELRWGAGLVVSGAAVTATPAGLAANGDWNGTTDTLIADDVNLAAAGTHVWEVTVQGQASSTLTSTDGDCELGNREAGTGLLNTATLESNGRASDSDACVPIDPSLTVNDQSYTRPWDSLPYTGSELLGLALTGLALVGVGLFFRGAARGRRQSSDC